MNKKGHVWLGPYIFIAIIGWAITVGGFMGKACEHPDDQMTTDETVVNYTHKDAVK